ncbi:hypothetical protein LWI28_001323 [Acer negundo]|uniref:Transposase MuDR plant domain-containing protein n=1 Tax=Acer negundo TaxID=4023 RepID=A0AAD5P3M8_ACENE|nr:hypothetical protein LWI28_001323 [Acer negundo]
MNSDIPDARLGKSHPVKASKNVIRKVEVAYGSGSRFDVLNEEVSVEKDNGVVTKSVAENTQSSKTVLIDITNQNYNRVAAYNEVNRAATADTEDGPTGFGNGPACVGDRPFNEEGDDELTREDVMRVKNLPRGFGSGSDNDDGPEDFGSLDGSNGEEDAEVPERKFIRRRYHKFNPRHDLQDLVFRLGMEFSNADVFRKAIRAHSVKHKRVVKFKKNDPNGIIVFCKNGGCKWFKNYIESLRIESEATYQWFVDKDLLHWPRAFFKDNTLYDMLCNNMCEAFNSVILQARDKHVVMHMEMIRIYFMKRLVTKRAAVQKWHHQIDPKVIKFVERIKMESSVCNPEYNGNYVYQVKENRFELFMVNIE